MLRVAITLVSALALLSCSDDEAALPIGAPCAPGDLCEDGAVCYAPEGKCLQVSEMPCADAAVETDGGACVTLVISHGDGGTTLEYVIK